MTAVFEPLESRRLMTATAATLTADAAAVASSSAALRATVASLKATLAGDRKPLQADLKSVSPKSQRAADVNLFPALARAESSGLGRVSAAANGLAGMATAKAAAATAQGTTLLKHPTSAADQAKVTAAVAALTAAMSAGSATLTSALSALEAEVGTTLDALVAADPSLATAAAADTADLTTRAAAVQAGATTVSTASTQEETDLGATPVAPDVTLTGATLFRGDATGDNLDSSTEIDHGGWTSGLDVQNVPGNYGGELFISKVANPTPSDFLTPGTLAASLATGANTFYFFADGDDTLGGSATFGLNLFLNGAAVTSPALSGYVVPGSGQTVVADGAPVTAAVSLAIVPGAGTLTTAAGSTGTVTLSSFTVLGVGGSGGSTVDLVDSTNTAPFSPPAHADGVPDTYGTFTITVTP